MGVLLYLPVIERPDTLGPETYEEREDTEEKAVIADPVDDKCLLARVGRGIFPEPEADQEVRAEAHAFPPDEHEKEIVRGHEDQHHEDKEIEVREVAGVAFVTVHVSNGIDMDQEADAGHNEAHDDGKRIDPEAHRRVEFTGRDPVEDVEFKDALFRRQLKKLEKNRNRNNEGGKKGETGNPGNNRLRQLLAEESVDEKADRREYWYQPDVINHV